jgi:antibiotic biosynthesis monooxygenase (ABM) superfamily enzyme
MRPRSVSRERNHDQIILRATRESLKFFLDSRTRALLISQEHGFTAECVSEQGAQGDCVAFGISQLVDGR